MAWLRRWILVCFSLRASLSSGETCFPRISRRTILRLKRRTFKSADEYWRRVAGVNCWYPPATSWANFFGFPAMVISYFPKAAFFSNLKFIFFVPRSLLSGLAFFRHGFIHHGVKIFAQ